MINSSHIISCIEFDGYSLLMYYVRDHVSKQEFLDAVTVEHLSKCNLCDIRHGYARNVPTGRKGETVMYLCDKGRGAYPITFVDLAGIEIIQ